MNIYTGVAPSKHELTINGLDSLLVLLHIICCPYGDPIFVQQRARATTDSYHHSALCTSRSAAIVPVSVDNI